MKITRRAFMQATAATAAALGVQTTGLLGTREARAAESGPSVIWLQGQGCTGCSVSLLNSVYYTTIDDLLVNTLDLNFHNTIMASAGSQAVAAAEAAYAKGGYVLVVEGAIPTGAAGAYCTVWPGMTIQAAVQRYAPNAAYLMAVGTCAAYGGISAAAPNPTGAISLKAALPGKTVVNIPGCPPQPDWIVGTIAYILQNGRAPTLDSNGRPTSFFANTVHSKCPRRDAGEANRIGQSGCLEEVGCCGKETKGDCATRKWNGGAAGAAGVNWCIGAGCPCHGCTEPNFPDGKSPFFYVDRD